MMLLGRGGERARIDRMLGGARAGAGGALVLRGEPGIGKSALLEYARSRAQGMRVVRVQARGSGAQGWAHAALSLVLRPLLGGARHLSTAEAAALDQVLAARDVALDAAPAELVGAATFGLLSAGGRVQPLLVVVDDAHLLDELEASALGLAAQHLHREPVAMLLAAEGSDERLSLPPGMEELWLEGLDPSSARALLVRLSAYEPDPAVLQQVLDETGGNPLALRELAGLLRKTHLTGEEPVASPLPVGARIAHAFLRPVRRLEHLTQTALLVAAAGWLEHPATLALALRLLVRPELRGEDLALVDLRQLERVALGPAEEAGLVEMGERLVRFHHPLVRSAVYHSVSAVQRRGAHLALARALALRPGASAAGRRAWHLGAASAATPRASTSAAVEAAALEAYSRQRYRLAAKGLERAASLAWDADHRARCFLRASSGWHLLGCSERADRLLDGVLEATTDRCVRADSAHLRGRLRTWTGQPAEAHRLLVAEAARIEPVDARRSALMLVDGSLASLLAGDSAVALWTAQRAQQLAAPLGGTAAKAAALSMTAIQVARGEATSGCLLMGVPGAVLSGDDVQLLDGQWISLAAQALIWLERYAIAEQALDLAVRRARAASMAALLPVPLALLAEAAFRTGRWEGARALAAEAVEVGERVGQPGGQALGLGCLARLDAARGLEQRSRTRAAAALERAARFPTLRPLATAALGLLALGIGQPHEAIQHLEKSGELLAKHGLGDPSVVQWTPDLIEAYVRAGRTVDARRLLDEFELQAERTERTWALATTARCRGLLAGEAEFEYHFSAAFRWHDRTDTPFERARTALCLGARLRQAGRRGEARVHLRAALVVLERLGATPWAQRARAELRMAGDHADVASWAERRLTPREAEVAWLVAQGRTNREVATALRVTPRTVAFHLSNIYQKLDLRSRADLVAGSSWMPAWRLPDRPESRRAC